MYNYSAILKNPYYFVTDKILFSISDKQDEDECGKHLVYYLPLKEKDKVTDKTQIVKPKQYYYDETHTLIQNGNTEVTTLVYGDDLNHTKCAAVFPHFDVKYSYNDGTDEEPVMKDYIIHYYLQSMVSIGDKFDNGTFTRNNKHTSNADVSYDTAFVNSIKDDIANMVENGNSIEQIKVKMPHWCFSDNINKVFKINSKKMTLVSVTGITTIDNQTLETLFENSIKEKVEKYANSLLKVDGKKVGNSFNLDIVPE